ncbi:hypothetical protein [Chryseobacterium sp.]|uniref:hypothetical protein n=1 Tax=Chryseobacterium sp. TaxID=1871047 RepID=UPI0028985693|nr:hypothetical protein [Chryseobacterium sp.]
MKKYIIAFCLPFSFVVFGQVTIGKAIGSVAPASTSVSIEFGDATGGVRGIVLPWATSETAVATTTPAPITGTIFFDSAVKKVKFGRAATVGATAVSEWRDLSLGALSPASTVGVPDTNTEVSTAKTIVAVNTTNAAANTTNGVLVLADTDKAMVLPRVNTIADIVNPSAGMMVFVTGTTPQQLAVFNGIQWSFWTKP